MKPKPQVDAPKTPDELAAAFPAARDELCTVNVLLSKRGDERKAILLSGTDADVIEHDRRTVALELRRDRAAARIESIRQEYPAAAERKLEADRVALRASAEQKRESGTAAYLRAEAKLREVFADLAIVFDADQAISSANANTAKDSPPLLPVEADFRWVDGIPSRVETRERKIPRSIIRQPGTIETIDEIATQSVVIPGRPAVRPAPLYDVLEAPALRPGDSPLRVLGTPVSPFLGHSVTKLKPAAPLPADDAPAAPVAALPAKIAG